MLKVQVQVKSYLEKLSECTSSNSLNKPKNKKSEIFYWLSQFKKIYKKKEMIHLTLNIFY